MYVWTEPWKRNSPKTLTTHYQFQSTSHNIIRIFKMAHRLFTLLYIMLGLISNLIVWRTSAPHGPISMKIKDSGNSLFCGLIIANTRASSMWSQVPLKVIVFKSILHILMDERKPCENASCGRGVFENGHKKVAFSNEYGYVRTRPYAVNYLFNRRDRTLKIS